MEHIRTRERLREILGHPSPAVVQKVQRHLTAKAVDFIQKSPLLFLATTDGNGQATVSPKGDLPGFVQIASPTTLLIPERKGNRLLMSLQNLLVNDRLGLLFLVPGTVETLRIQGSCRILLDEDMCQRLSARNKPAVVVLQLEIEESFFQCGKSFLRSDVWNTASWPPPVGVSFGEEIAANLKPSDREQFVKEFDCMVQDRYRNDL